MSTMSTKPNPNPMHHCGHVLNAPMKGFPLEFGIGVRGTKCLNDGAARWSKKF